MSAAQRGQGSTLGSPSLKERTKTGRARAFTIERSLLPLLEVLLDVAEDGALLFPVKNENHATLLRDDLREAGCTREALYADDEMRAPIVFHNLRDTCLTHMAVRRDPPQDIQWRAGHSTPAMTERYIAEARFAAGLNFGTPFPALPADVLVLDSIGLPIGSNQKKTPISRGFLCEGGDLNPYDFTR